ncbi:hypothetical protein GCM10023149_48810 [Mucilaginibacter gynuensis]|uniref:Uncharacterized protein n=1 Tax=Mucilaginibacter gynuensis TaxID=1302236 RepID=A0ABP8HFS7_9SPHI
MEKYTLEMKAFKTVEVEAETLKEALKQAREQNPEFHTEIAYIQDSGIEEDIYSCGGCGTDMVEGDNTGYSEDGEHYCVDCWAGIMGAYHDWRNILDKRVSEKGLIIPEESHEEVNDLYRDGLEPEKALEYLIARKLVSSI